MKTAEASRPPDAAASAELSDSQLIARIVRGDTSSFEQLVARYQPKIFGTVRRYARRSDEVEDIVQEIFLKAFQKLNTFRGDAPFEHWLMRLAVRTCYDFLRQHQRNREHNFSDSADEDADFLERAGQTPNTDQSSAAAALVEAVLSRLSPPARLVITLLEIEERSIKEIAQLTGWSTTLVKVRAFRARAEMKKILARLPADKYL